MASIYQQAIKLCWSVQTAANTSELTAATIGKSKANLYRILCIMVHHNNNVALL